MPGLVAASSLGKATEFPPGSWSIWVLLISVLLEEDALSSLRRGGDRVARSLHFRGLGLQRQAQALFVA